MSPDAIWQPLYNIYSIEAASSHAIFGMSLCETAVSAFTVYVKGVSLQRYNAGDVDGVMELMDKDAQCAPSPS